MLPIQHSTIFMTHILKKVLLVGYYLLEPENLSWNYVREVLGGQKQLLKKSELALIDIPPKSLD